MVSTGEYRGVQGGTGEFRGVQGGRGSGVVFSSWPGCCNFVFRREIFWGKVQNIYYIPGSGPEIFSKCLI